MRQQRWNDIHACGLEQHGFVTTADLRQLGLPKTYAAKIAHRGVLEPVARGLYRVPQIPVTRLTPYMEAVMWVGAGAALSHDAVLSMHELAGANPRVLRVTTPRRVRKSDPPAGIKIVQRALAAGDLTVHEGIPCTTVARALRDCVGLIMTTRLVEAAHEARDQGLVRRSEAAALIEELETADG
jgi:predicted transcriptional regulator of viral defense system